MAQVALPVLSGQNVECPPQPQNPPSEADFARAIRFASRLTEAHLRDSSTVTDSDVVKGHAYATQMAMLSAGHAAEPPWFQQAMVDLRDSIKEDTKASIREESQKLELSLSRKIGNATRSLVIMANQTKGTGEGETFGVVPFANGDDPTAQPHNLPALTTRTAVQNLSADDVENYYKGYFPRGQHQANNRRLEKIFEATGIRKEL